MLTEEDMDKLNSPISVKEVATVVKKFPTEKIVVPDGFTGKFKSTWELCSNRK